MKKIIAFTVFNIIVLVFSITWNTSSVKEMWFEEVFNTTDSTRNNEIIILNIAEKPFFKIPFIDNKYKIRQIPVLHREYFKCGIDDKITWEVE